VPGMLSTSGVKVPCPAWLMEAICEPVNLKQALKRVKANNRTAVYGPVCTVVWEEALREEYPYSDSVTRPEYLRLIPRH
jgi:hypothetical protein